MIKINNKCEVPTDVKKRISGVRSAIFLSEMKTSIGMRDYEEVIQKYYNKYIPQSCTGIHDLSALADEGSLFYVPTT